MWKGALGNHSRELSRVPFAYAPVAALNTVTHAGSELLTKSRGSLGWATAAIGRSPVTRVELA
jgi:hypothetical protein